MGAHLYFKPGRSLTGRTSAATGGSTTRDLLNKKLTYKTKLKLDKEVGGGDLAELCTITMLIVYPYA